MLSDIIAQVIEAVPELKPYLKTYDELYSRLWGAAVRLFNGGKDANFLGSFARSIDQQLTEAWNTGADDVGVAPEDMTPDDMTILEGIINNENDFLDGIAGDIATDRDAGMTREDFDSKYGSRVDLWANRYTEVVNTARMHFGGKQRLVWRLGQTEQHCPECEQLDGIVAWADEWSQADIHPQDPPNRHLTCGGWRCDCRLEPTTDRRTARAIDRITEIALQGNT
jgi:hypothetical protein